MKHVLKVFVLLLCLQLLLGATGCGPKDTVPPTISYVSHSTVAASGATITWITNEGATSEVEYGPTSEYDSSSRLNPTLVTTHSVTITGLPDATVCHYRVKSKDASGNEMSSKDQTFMTLQSASDMEVLSHTSYVSDNGTYHVVGEMCNKSANIVRQVQANATLYGSDNAVIGTISAFTMIDTLLPDQKSPFEIVETNRTVAASVDHYQITMSDCSVAAGQAPYRDLSVLKHNWMITIDTGGIIAYHVQGQIQNTGTATATSVKVVLTFYVDGKVVAVGSAPTDPVSLAPGQTGTFDYLALDGRSISGLVGYEPQAVCA